MTRTVLAMTALLAGLMVAGCYSPYQGHWRGDRYHGPSYYDRDWRRDNDRYDRGRYRGDWRYR